MQRLHWYKVSTHLFSDPAIRHILGYPNGDTYFVILFYLKELACAACDDGNLSISHDVPLLVRDIARGCGRRKSVIEKAIRVFLECGLVDVDEETGMIRITDWDDMQSLCKDEEKRAQTRKRVAAYRERKKKADDMGEKDSEMAVQEEENCRESSYSSEVKKVSQPILNMPQPITEATSQSVLHYQEVFGPASTIVATRLADLESLWPVDTIMAAIDMAKSRGRGNIRYIEKIIENGAPTKFGPTWDDMQIDLEIQESLAKFQREEEKRDRLQDMNDTSHGYEEEKPYAY